MKRFFNPVTVWLIFFSMGVLAQNANSTPADSSLASPVLLPPIVIADTVILRWHSVVGDSVNYACYLWRYLTDGSMSLRIDTTNSDTTLKVTLPPRSRYYWKVIAFNRNGTSAFSPVDSFTVLIEVAAPPVAVSPKSLTGLPTWPRQTTFVWHPAANALWYHLQVATSQNFSTDIVVDIAVIADTTEQITDTLMASTMYYYRLSSINLAGEGAFSSIVVFTTGTTVTGVHQASMAPTEFVLLQNYPNPFNPSTVISYKLPTNNFVRIKIYDLIGKEVETLVNQRQTAGNHSVTYNASKLPNGVYFCKFQAGNYSEIKKLTLIK